MTVQELLQLLEAIEDKSKEVYVWEGENSVHMTSDFEVTQDDCGHALLERGNRL